MLKATALITLTLFLSACSTLEFPGVYRLAIEQGNIINGEMVAKLQPGMSKSQVEYILGRALIRDPFSPNRWDYVYNLQKADKSTERKLLTVFFNSEGNLDHFTSTVAPITEEEKAAQAKQKAEATEADAAATDTTDDGDKKPLMRGPRH